ncbi:cell wall-binding repeat-containing protein [Neobacillus pocheonensis]|uniref:cell wall-binding repeat-containing protein n=1 Tax=Neobacillus pocheonensis TaxID=363869 RepID=UPI003D280BC9
MKRSLASFLVVFIFLISSAVQALAAEGTNERIQGADRFEVAVNISNKGWPNGSDTVLLVNYNAYADALSATPLAYNLKAPILLTHSANLTDATKAELQRLHPQNVIIVGGEGSVTSNVLNAVTALGIPNVKRISGSDRYEVAYQVAKEMPPSDKVVVAYGLNFPDALSIAPYAARNGYPILLTNSSNMPAKTQEALAIRNAKESIVVGGEASVSPAVFNQLPSPMRIGGADRYEVAANIIKTLNLNTSTAFIATGLTFADALTGSVLAAGMDAPVLLTAPKSLPNATKSIIAEKGITNFMFLGGLGSVSQNIVSQIVGSLAGLKIVVDAGHGGDDPGASGYGLDEKEVVLDVAKRVQLKLEAAGATIVMTRESDTYPTLEDRVNLANDQKADSFVSIHANSSLSPAASGSETYWNSKYFGNESKALAQSIQTELYKQMDTKDRGVKEADFYVIKNTNMPSVLVELAFISNASDAAKLGDPNYREQAAEAIYQGFVNYYSKR